MHPQEPLYEKSLLLARALKRRFPSQFADLPLARHWPVGWHGIVTGVCQNAADLGIPVQWVQITEKFGGLRMYRKGGRLRLDYISPSQVASVSLQAETETQLDEVIDQAELKSEHTCMRCGKAGGKRVFKRLIVTLCDEDARRYAEDDARHGAGHD